MGNYQSTFVEFNAYRKKKTVVKRRRLTNSINSNFQLKAPYLALLSFVSGPPALNEVLYRAKI